MPSEFICLSQFLYLVDMCKHVHLALLTAAKRNINVIQERERLAADIVKNKHYSWDRDHLEVINHNDDISIVTTKDMICTCTAYSHQIKCVCLHVAEMLCFNWDDQVNVFISDLISMEKIPSTQEIIHHKISDIFNWISRGEVELTVNAEDILKQVTILHSMMSKAKYKLN